MVTNRIPKQALHYKPKGRRHIGRPRKRKEVPISFWGYKEQESNLILPEHDDDDDDDEIQILKSTSCPGFHYTHT